jgi:activator of 2-hydroxyglutaryl-CoA dehydratase
MGIAEKHHFSFVQEVIASSEVIQTKYPSTRTLIDIGGEDAKIIFFEQGKLLIFA